MYDALSYAQVGTFLYLAPEVLHGTGDQEDQARNSEILKALLVL